MVAENIDFRKLSSIGRSLAVTIPHKFIKKLNWKPGMIVRITLDDGKIIIEGLEDTII